MRDAGKCPGRGVVGRDQRQMKDVIQGNPLVGAQECRGGGVGVATLDRDLLREIGIVFEEHHGGHHLGDARDGALVLRVLGPQNLAGFRIENDGRRRTHVRHQRAGFVGLVARRHHLLKLPQPRLFPGPGRRTRARQPRPTGRGRAGRVGRLLFGDGRGLAGGRLFRGLRGSQDDCRHAHAQSERNDTRTGHVRTDHAHETSGTTLAGWGQP